MITEFTGFGRVLTTIARGYLFHDKDGVVLDDPYERIEIARNALCAWCSIPEKKKNSDPPVDFRELSADYPELVDANGNGWYYRHIKSVIRFVKANPDKVSKSAYKKCVDFPTGFTTQCFDAYFGNNNLSKKWLAKIPTSVICRENKHGVCRYRLINQ